MGSFFSEGDSTERAGYYVFGYLIDPVLSDNRKCDRLFIQTTCSLTLVECTFLGEIILNPPSLRNSVRVHMTSQTRALKLKYADNNNDQQSTTLRGDSSISNEELWLLQL